MEHLLCTICDPPRRHPMSEPHRFRAKSVEEDARGQLREVPAPEKSAVEKPAADAADEDAATAGFVREASKRVLEKSEWECPVCAERKARHAARVRRWREKQRG